MKIYISKRRSQLLAFLRPRFPRVLKVLKNARGFITGLQNHLLEGFRILAPQHSMRIGGPKGGFSEYDALNDQEREMQTAVVDQEAPVIREKSMLLLSHLNQHAEQPFPIFWRKIANAHLVGSSLVRLDKAKRISDDYRKNRFSSDRSYKYFTLPKATRLSGPWTSIVSNWTPADKSTNYAHWLLDALPRLNLLEKFPSETQIIVPKNLASFQKDSLEILGLLERCRPTDEKHLLIDEYFYSSPPSMVVCWSPYSIDFLRSRLLPFGTTERSPLPRRFYLKRRGFRNISNAGELESFFTSRGWSVIDAECFTFSEQIALFAQAEAICAIHGAGLANLAWCSPGCKVFEIFSSSYLSGCYEWMAEYCQLPYGFIVCPDDANMNATVDLKTLEAHLRAMKML